MPKAGATASTRPSFLLISIDTTRADRLGCYGRAPSPTPNIDAWATEGVVFEAARTPVPLTLPAHTTLMTGLLPHRHGVRDNGIYRVPADVPTLASTLSASGYDTAAVVGSAVLDRQFGLDRGFTVWDDVAAAGGGLAIVERRAAEVTDAALALARSLRPPFLLFVHYFDPHATYAPPPPFDQRFRAAPYEGEIAYVDQEIGRLRRELTGAGLLKDAVVVLTADHGEGLGEHGEEAHGVFLYDSTVHVPLVVVGPGRWPAGQRVPNPVSLADVAPTILDLAGQAASAFGVDGRSLSAVVAGEGDERWLALESEFGANSYGWAPLVALTDGKLKWVGAPRPELYDLTSDANEERNLSGQRPDDVGRLALQWREQVTEDRRSRPGAEVADRAEAETRERLAALGYVAGTAAPRPTDPGSLPDPKDAIGSLRLINEARTLIETRRAGEARRRLEQALAQSPRSVSALTLLAVTHMLDGRPGAAVTPLKQAARISPANAEVTSNLGLALAGVGDAAGAEAAFRRTLALAPRTHDAAVNLVDLLINTGRPGEAADVLRSARGEGLASPALDFLDGKLAASGGDRQRAGRLLESALRGGLPPPAAAEARALLRQVGSVPGP